MYIEEGGTDEISILETSINQMSEQLQTYIEKEYKDEIERGKLEQETTQEKILALQSQDSGRERCRERV